MFVYSINLKVKDFSLVAIVGSVGAGKSSLLSAILGDTEKLNGNVTTRVSVINIFFHCMLRCFINFLFALHIMEITKLIELL